MLFLSSKHESYWIAQQLGPNSVTWKLISFSCLKMRMSPTRRSCARANSFQPSVSLRPSSVFTSHVFSDAASDVSFAVVFWSFLPCICLEKKATGIVWTNMQNTKPSLNWFLKKRQDRYRRRERERERQSTKWLWKPGRRGWKKCFWAILRIVSKLLEKINVIINQLA